MFYICMISNAYNLYFLFYFNINANKANSSEICINLDNPPHPKIICIYIIW